VQAPQLAADYGGGVLATFREGGELQVDFGSKSGNLTMAGLQHALEKAWRNAVHDPDFKSLPSRTGEQPALENYHAPKLMDLAEKTLVDLKAEGKLAQPLKPNTVRIDDDFISLFRQIFAITRDRQPTLVWSAEGTVVALELVVRRVHVGNADDMG
jgi:hypothetical protein